MAVIPRGARAEYGAAAVFIAQTINRNVSLAPEKRGGLNESTQHSARAHLAFNAKAKKTPAGLDGPERYPGQQVDFNIA
jgi:hypothetical protein